MGSDVFLCYNRADQPTVVSIAERLKGYGLRVWLDEWELRPGKRWGPELEKQIEECASAAVFVGPDGQGPWQRAEIQGLLEQLAERECTIIPVLLPDCPGEPKLPLFLKGLTWVDFRRAEPDPFGRLVWGITGTKPADQAPPAPAVAAMRVEDVEVSRLPITDEKVFGRKEILAALDAAWDGPARKHVVSLVAWGGVGKTAVVNRWRAGLAKEAWRGAARVFAWSFYSQGTREERAASSDEMIAALLRRYGDPDPSAGAPEDKGARLARLVRAKRTLLILDGVEPLQHPPGPDEGRIKDPALATLLRELAADNPGLCVLSTRLRVADLADWESGPAERIELETLTPEAGSEVLASHGVTGDPAELLAASGEYDGHALALSLLGRYLKRRFDGDITRRGEVGPLEAETTRGKHAARVMEAYARWWGDGAEIAVLQVLGLFDRPAKAEALAALRPARGAAARRLGVNEVVAIPGLTDKVPGFREWEEAVANLRTAGLLAPRDPNEPGTLDTHPLVREHFGERLHRRNLEAWKAGHSRLFEYYQRAAPELPDTLEAMAPLYAAVGHGCKAGRYDEAFRDVFWRRIRRGESHYSILRLCAYASDLSSLAGFFDPPWEKVAESLHLGAQASVLYNAGFSLRALGRLREALEPTEAALRLDNAMRVWANVTTDQDALSELHSALGNVAVAITLAREAVDTADRVGDPFSRAGHRTTLADALHQSGNDGEAALLFERAEAIHAASQPRFPELYSVQGTLYAEFLLDRGEAEAVRMRASRRFEWRLASDSPLDVALDHLTRGLASTALGRLADALVDLEQAVGKLRDARVLEYLCRGLLARADLHLSIAERTPTERDAALSAARADLAEVTGIATRCGMRLFEADAALGWTRWHLLAGDPDAARRHLARARYLVDTTGYHRRDAEIDALTARLPTV